MDFWKIIKGLNIKRLPVNPVLLARNLGIEIKTYEELADILGCTVEDICKEYCVDGLTMCGTRGHAIYYNTSIKSKGRRRWTLIHEICHILLGHVTKEKPVLLRSHKKEPEDKQADHLTSLIVAPISLLYECNVQSSAELRALCGLSYEATYNAFEAYRKAVISGTAEKHAKDLVAFENALPFVEWYNREGDKHITADVYVDKDAAFVEHINERILKNRPKRSKYYVRPGHDLNEMLELEQWHSSH